MVQCAETLILIGNHFTPLIDLVFYIVIVLAIIQGFRKGLLMALFSFLCLIVGLAAAVKLSAVVADNLSREPGVHSRWLPVLSFIAVFLIVALLVRFVGKLLESAIKMVMLGWLNRLGGIILYLILYTAVYSILLYYGSGMHLFTPQAETESHFYSIIAPMGPKVIEWISIIIPFGRDMFDALKRFFESAGARIG